MGQDLGHIAEELGPGVREARANALEHGEVGIVFVREISRLSRNPVEAARFVHSAKTHGTLIYANGVVRDPATDDVFELFGLQLEGLLAWYENATRTRNFMAARIAKARQGHAVSPPPIGYVRSVRGQWDKDPDPLAGAQADSSKTPIRRNFS